MEFVSKLLTPTLPHHKPQLESAGGDAGKTVQNMIEQATASMYATGGENKFLEVTYASGDKETLYFKDFSSGAMIESIVRRAKKLALKRYINSGEKGLTLQDMLDAVREEFKENEDLPNTTNPDDWAKIAGRKKDRIVYVKPLIREEKIKPVEKIQTGQYL